MIISFIRTIIVYVVIMLAVRIMGKRQISQLQTNELVVTLLISDLAVIPMQDSGQPLTSGLIPILLLISLELLVSIVMVKSQKFRGLLCGKPVFIVKDGEILQKELQNLRMSVEDVFEQLRLNDVFSVDEVRYAIVETNGNLSIVKKDNFENPRNMDLNINIENEPIHLVVISDGEICKSSLRICNKDKTWIDEILDKKGLDISDVFIMTANELGRYNIVERKDI
ncbi:MAG: DUF421 domain-containing protein [Clostridia bacterium]